MSPIGRIFIVLNLILAAVFAGWAANNLKASDNYKQLLADKEQELADTATEKDGEISTLSTKVSTLEGELATLRQEANTLGTDRTRLEGELSKERDKNNALQADVAGIKASLESYVENNVQLNQRLEQAVSEVRAADAEKRDAEDAREDALAAQRAAEENLASANKRVADLERDSESLRKQVADLDAQLGTLVAITGVPIDQIKSMPLINGAVLQVVDSMQPGLVSINRGTDDGVQRGFTFEIYSGNKYKGQVRVESVQKNICTAIVVRTHNGASISAGDSAATQI